MKDSEKLKIKTYPEAARVIALYLEEFCDKNLPYPAMIADAARKACFEIEDLRRSSKDSIPF
jgi:hypothetical protein